MKYLAFITVAVLVFLGIMMAVHHRKPMMERNPVPAKPILVPVVPVKPQQDKKPDINIDLKFIENHNRKR